jgi:hypothetical protein
MTQPSQFNFGFEAEHERKRTEYLPSTMEEAIPFYRDLIDTHHAAMMVGDADAVLKLRREARDLAAKLNGGDTCGILAPEGPAKALEAATAAPEGQIPKWGQSGNYTIDVNGMKVRIEQDGMFGVGTFSAFWPGFSAHAVDYDKPFLSETGYRSFIGVHADVSPGVSPDRFAGEVIGNYLQAECKGKPRRIQQSYVERETARRSVNALPAKEGDGHAH